MFSFLINIILGKYISVNMVNCCEDFCRFYKKIKLKIFMKIVYW